MALTLILANAHQAHASDNQAGQVVLNGTVAHYDVAKSIEVTADGTSHKYDLNDADTVYSISPEVAEGSTVTVTETTDSQGHKSISIAPRPPPKPKES